MQCRNKFDFNTTTEVVHAEPRYLTPEKNDKKVNIAGNYSCYSELVKY